MTQFDALFLNISAFLAPQHGGGHGTMIIKSWSHGMNTLLVIVVFEQAYICNYKL